MKWNGSQCNITLCFLLGLDFATFLYTITAFIGYRNLDSGAVRFRGGRSSFSWGGRIALITSTIDPPYGRILAAVSPSENSENNVSYSPLLRRGRSVMGYTKVGPDRDFDIDLLVELI